MDKVAGKRDAHKYYENKKAKGCLECGQPPEDGSVYCTKCKQGHKERRRKRAANGVCTDCGSRPPEPGQQTCSLCRKRANTLRSKRRAAGLCPKCGRNKPRPGFKQCTDCQAKQRQHMQELRDATFAAYGGYKCVCCGETHPEFLQLDHIHNDGNVHRRLLKAPGGDRLYLWLRNNGYPPIVQVLCANCNYAKAHYGFCPHHPDREVNDAPLRKDARRPVQAGSVGR